MNRTDPPEPLASRFDLIRPLQGRYVAGVCAALGRSTRTDPVLWRVVLAVLICFGGLGALVYLAVWLLTPEEGDTASPLEAAFGRGYSNTSPVLVVVLGVATLALLAWTLSQPFQLILLVGGVALTVLLWRERTGAAGGSVPPEPETTDRAAAEPGAASGPGVAEPPAPEPADEPPATEATTQPVPEASTERVTEATPEPMAQASPERAPAAAVPPIAEPPTSEATGPAGAPAQFLSPVELAGADGGYRPPFAPHGPFGGPPPPPPPRRRERSILGAVTLSVLVGVLGLLGLLELAGAADIPLPGYLAAALVVLGGGLVIGAWLGRARSLIAFGLVLLLGLPVAHTIDQWDPRHPVGTQAEWVPTSAAELDDEYRIAVGDGTLDLRQLDLTGQPLETRVRVHAAHMLVRLPPTGTVTVHSEVALGNVRVFGRSNGGVHHSWTVTDHGVLEPADQPDQVGAGPDPTPPGGLTLHLEVHVGEIEVMR